jgi:hypothetical protein
MKYTSFTTSIFVSLAVIGTLPIATSQPQGSASPSSDAVVKPRSNVEKRNAQTGRGLKKSLSSDSKIAKNVLESSGEGYCSVSSTLHVCTFPLMPYIA